ncbi:MAG: hypothetical protein ACLU4J_10980 [Butyricimonas paravirosa]
MIRKLERWFGVEIENQCLHSSALLFMGYLNEVSLRLFYRQYVQI